MTDRYIKIVLTVIACALVAIAGENVPLSSRARAQAFGAEPAHVVVDSFNPSAFRLVEPIEVRDQG